MISAKNIKEFCDPAKYGLKHGGHEHVFFSAVQIASWWQRFCSCTEEVKEGVAETDLIEVKRTLLFYDREYLNYLRNQQLRRLRHTSVVERATRFWGKGPCFNSMVARNFCDAPGHIKSTQSRWTNSMSIVPRLPPDEQFFYVGSSAFSSKALLHLEQKYMLWMKDTNCKFALPLGLNVDCCVN